MHLVLDVLCVTRLFNKHEKAKTRKILSSAEKLSEKVIQGTYIYTELRINVSSMKYNCL